MSTVTVLNNGIKYCFEFTGGENLLEFLAAHGISIAAPCGGHGVCGKCTVELISASGRRMVKACAAVLKENCEVIAPESAGEIDWNGVQKKQAFDRGRSGFGAAVDLGTTTVCVSLINLENGERAGSVSRWNAQQVYGADVISRAGYCAEHEDGLAALSNTVREQILEMLHGLCSSNYVNVKDVKEIFLAGNTVMQHIFAGISPAGIAAAPFTPESYFDGGERYELGNIPVSLSPCVAGYVGGDITAGALSTEMIDKDGLSLFIDVGTNGEMLLGGKNGLTSCAVASGPAFEGAGITCGMSAGNGAVYSVELTGEGLSYEVIGGGKAKGICGSGLLDLAACLLELGYIDESGRLEENEDGESVFYLSDKIYITQKDVRQLQLAKAAVAAGIRLLMENKGIGFENIRALYLAGGFGSRLRPASAVKIGMLPKELLGRTEAVGNACLAGAEQALLSGVAREKLREIKSRCEYIELSSHPKFNDVFVDEMQFPEVDL